MVSLDRIAEARRGYRLELLTVGYNLLEAVIAVAAGVAAGSVALAGFGVDAVVECASGAVLLWRLRLEAHRRREEFERRAQRIVGVSFFLLAGYVGIQAGWKLVWQEAPEESRVGILLACASLVVMPVLAAKKRAVGRRINSSAMVSDSRQTQLCAYLSAILLAGLWLNATLGWWWADPVAALLMTPIILKEGWDAWCGLSCGCHSR